MADAPLLAATGLTKRFGGLVAVSGVSLTAMRGEIHAVIGPNGAGKTTLVNLLSGDLGPSEGAIHLGGRDITRLRPDRRARAGLARSYQRTSIFAARTGYENARLAAQASGRRPVTPFSPALADGDAHDRARLAIAEAGLRGREGIPAKALSHGEQRQLEIAMVLAARPDVVLLDEPLAGMGAAEAALMVDLIRRLKQGRAIILVEHDMDAVFALADRLTVMADGRVIASGPPADMRADPAVRSAYLGETA
jgi:branched-chain amino acid transport system ATP-binding protein